MHYDLRATRDFLIVTVLGLVALGLVVGGIATLAWYRTQQPGTCNVATVQLYGSLVYYPNESLGDGSNASSADQTAAEDVRQQIEAADADPGIRAILLQIDSPGGDPVAGEDVAAALKHASKPTVALIGDEGDSAAYWAATGADTIFASTNSSVGDIGVTGSYLDQTKQNRDNGLTFVPLTAGAYKDMGNPDAPLTAAERAIIQRELDATRDTFVADVAANRDLPVATVNAIADGSDMLGQDAIGKGLIDATGTIYDVEDFLSKKLGTDVTLCE
jgi:protease-4